MLKKFWNWLTGVTYVSPGDTDADRKQKAEDKLKKAYPEPKRNWREETTLNTVYRKQSQREPTIPYAASRKPEPVATQSRQSETRSSDGPDIVTGVLLYSALSSSDSSSSRSSSYDSSSYDSGGSSSYDSGSSSSSFD